MITHLYEEWIFIIDRYIITKQQCPAAGFRTELATVQNKLTAVLCHCILPSRFAIKMRDHHTLMDCRTVEKDREINMLSSSKHTVPQVHLISYDFDFVQIYINWYQCQYAGMQPKGSKSVAGRSLSTVASNLGSKEDVITLVVPAQHFSQVQMSDVRYNSSFGKYAIFFSSF